MRVSFLRYSTVRIHFISMTHALNQRDIDVNPDHLFDDNDAFDCKYYSAETLSLITQNFTNNGLSVICFNIRSFHKNGDEFLGYLSNFQFLL